MFLWISVRFWIHQPRMAEIASGEPERLGDLSMLDDFETMQADLARIEPDLARPNRGDA